MIQIKLLKDWKTKRAGDIINISEKGAEQFIKEGAGEYLNIEKENIKGIHKFMAEDYFDNATYNEEEDIIEIGNKESINSIKKINSIITSYFSKEDLAQQILNIQPLHYDENKIWWIWDLNNLKWKISDETDILNFVKKLSNANTINSKEKIEILEALRQESRLMKPKPIKKTWIQFKDEIYDVENGEKFKVSSEFFVTNPIPYKISGNSSTPNIDKIFTEWVGDTYKNTLYEIISYCLLPDYPINRMFCFIGGGMNGKTCFLNLLKKFIGEENVTSTELDLLLSSRFEITRLHKKLVCMMGETNFNEMTKTSTIKKLTGQDLIGFEYKNKNPFDDYNYAKILIATNNLPTTTDKTIGFYRRWLIIDFPNQFSEKKDILSNIPEEEFSNLATECLCRLNTLLKNREFSNEGSIEERMKRYEDHSDPLEKFMKEFTDEDPDKFIWKFEFEKRLNDWCKDNRFRQLSEITIGKKMKEKGIEQGQRDSDWLIDGTHKKLRAWFGIKWKEEIKKQAEQG